MWIGTYWIDKVIIWNVYVQGGLKNEEDMIVEEFETVADIYDIYTDQLKKEEITIILKGSEFRLYYRSIQRVNGYCERI